MGTLAVAALAALAPVLSILVSYVLSRKNMNNAHMKTRDKLNTIEVLVNGRMSAALARIAELEQALGLTPEQPIPEPRMTISVQDNSDPYAE